MNMKKNNIIGLMLIGLVALMPQLSIQAQEVSKEFKVDNFHNLDLTTVGSVYFTQASKCSVKIDGKKENVDKLDVYVENGTLNIEPKEKNLNGTKNGVGKADIHVECQEINAEINGIGSLTLSGKTKKATIDKDGIGVVDTHNLKITE